jgi:diacylglycerol kinase family enzyme
VEIHERRPGRRIFLATDGELTEMREPLRFRSRPGALTVLVPSDVPASADVSAPDASPQVDRVPA